MVVVGTPGRFSSVFLDLDGTLADSIPVSSRVHAAFLAAFGVTEDDRGFEDVNGPSIPEIVDLLRSKYRLEEDAARLLDLYRQALVTAYGAVQPFAGAEAVLRELTRSGFRLFLVTSADRALATAFLQRHHLDPYFEDCVCGTDVTRAKPDAEIYRLAIRKAGTSPDRILAVEDSGHGVASAKAAGIFVVGVDRRGNWATLSAAGADATISDLREILPVLYG